MSSSSFRKDCNKTDCSANKFTVSSIQAVRPRGCGRAAWREHWWSRWERRPADRVAAGQDDESTRQHASVQAPVHAPSPSSVTPPHCRECPTLLHITPHNYLTQHSHRYWPEISQGWWLNCNINSVVQILKTLTLWHPLLPYGYSYKASCARPG